MGTLNSKLWAWLIDTDNVYIAYCLAMDNLNVCSNIYWIESDIMYWILCYYIVQTEYFSGIVSDYD